MLACQIFYQIKEQHVLWALSEHRDILSMMLHFFTDEEIKNFQETVAFFFSLLHWIEEFWADN